MLFIFRILEYVIRISLVDRLSLIFVKTSNNK